MIQRAGIPKLGMRFRVHRFAALTAMVAFASCTHDAPSTADIPDASAPPPAPAATSRFSVPLHFDFTSIVRVVEHAVPTTLGSMDSVRMVGTDSHRHYAFKAERGPFTAFAEDSLFHLGATLQYEARGYYKPIVGPTIAAGCGNGTTRPRIVVELTTPLGLAKNWHLTSRARVVRVEPASSEPRDHCDVSILHRDVTDRVVEAARAGLASHLTDIDRVIGAINLRHRAEEWWGALARPIKLADGVWLLLQPEGLRVGRVSGQDHVLTVPVTLDAHPRIVTGAQPPTMEPIVLPTLGKDTISSGFHIILDGVVDYSSATRAINAALGQRRVDVGGKSITINAVTVIPASHGSLVLGVTFSGDAHGLLRLRGTPHYDLVRREMTFPDLDFDLATDSQLIRAYSWLQSDELRATFRERARIPVAPAVERGREMLLQGLNRKIGDALSLAATVDSVAVQAVFVTAGGLIVRAEATGRAGASVAPR
ncbi:MAG: DUF4403 family protein [bacterium]